MKKRKKEQASAGAPEYMVTFGDMMSLLLCFFVIIVSMSEVKKDERFKQVMESIRQAFGNTGEVRTVISDDLDPNSLLKKLQTLIIPRKPEKGDSDDAGIKGKVFRVTDIREGIHVEIGGRVTFERFSATLKPDAEFIIAQVAAKIAGHNTIIKVTGHATNEPLPGDSPWSDSWNLSYARARAAAAALMQNGVRQERIRLIAAGSEAPLVREAYDEDSRSVNRRVEIVVTEATIDDYHRESFADEVPEATDAGR
jgi:chemotaxis protein MotB